MVFTATRHGCHGDYIYIYISQFLCCLVLPRESTGQLLEIRKVVAGFHLHEELAILLDVLLLLSAEEFVSFLHAVFCSVVIHTCLPDEVIYYGIVVPNLKD